MQEFDEKYLAALDLGSSKVALCVALVQEGDVHVVHYREIPSEGIQSSSVYIPMKTAKVVSRAIAEAEEELMVKIRRVVVGMPRNDVAQVSASAALTREDPDEYVTAEEVQAIKDMAVATYPLPYPDKQAIFGAIAQSFTIEDGMQLPEADVVGTLSSTLEGNFRVFVGRRQAVVALERMFRGTEVGIQKKYFLPEVTARAVLSREEMRSGTALVDIGAGVTSVAIYRKGLMCYYASIPFGGGTVTADIATECSVDEDLAEKMKRRFGVCGAENLGKMADKVLQVRLTDPYRNIPVRYLSEIITARYGEILDAVLWHIRESGCADSLRGGIVLTGGGAEQRGLEQTLRELSGCPVRKGYPRPYFTAPAGSAVMCTSSTAAVGMILAARDEGLPDCVQEMEAPKEEPLKVEPKEEPKQAPGNPEGKGAEVDAPAPEGELFSKEEQGTVEGTTKEGKAGKAPRKTRSAPKPPTDEEEEKTGTLPLVWHTIGKALLDFYDRMNQ